MNTQQSEQVLPKSIKQKSKEELEKDIRAMDDYQADQLRLQSQGQAAKAELAARLGHELNQKGGLDLWVEKEGNAAITKIVKKQFSGNKDVVLIAICVDNDYAQNETQNLNEVSIKKLLDTALSDHLPNGTQTSAISLQQMAKDNLRPFQEAFTKFTNACSWHNKTVAGQIAAKYKHPFSFKPQRFLPKKDK